jgi:hypothetical protein
MQARTPVPPEFRNAEPTASQKQLDYIRDLMEQRNLEDLSAEKRESLKQPEEFWAEETTRLSKTKASRIIKALLDLPHTPRESKAGITAAANLPKVPDGRYAIPKDDGTLMFYSVKMGRSVVFVDVWASDNRWPIKNPIEKQRILTEIAKDPKEAMNRFGMEIGRCGRCGRTLTREDSRMRGLGPDCAGIMAGNYGW